MAPKKQQSEYQKYKKAYKRSCKKKVRKFRKWIQKAKDKKQSLPPVLFMYMDKDKLKFCGHPAIVKKFNVSSDIIRPLVDAALIENEKGECSSSVGLGADGRKPKSQLKTPFLERLMAHGVNAVNIDNLKQAIANVANNGQHVQYFWRDPANQPSWWPRDIPFISPNSRPAHGNYLKPEQIRILGECLRAFLLDEKKSPGLESDNSEEKMDSKEENISCGDEERETPKKKVKFQEPKSTPVREKKETNEKFVNSESPNTGYGDTITQLATRCNNFLSVFSTLNASATKELTDLIKTDDIMSSIRIAIDGMKQNFTIDKLPDEVNQEDKRFTKIKSIPRGMSPLKSTGDGDCLFNSVGVSLFGTERFAPVLRLGSALSAIEHIEHYADDYTAVLSTAEDAMQFIYNVSTEQILSRIVRSERKDVRSMILMMLEAEILETMKAKSFSGLMQIRFLASVLKEVINLHNEEDIFFFTGMIPPCRCILPSDFNCHVLAVKSTVSGQYNHFVPLLHKRATRTQKQASVEPRLDVHAGKRICAGNKRFGCFVKDNAESRSWIKCRRCCLFYHAQCAGIKASFSQVAEFQCCCDIQSTSVDFNDENCAASTFPKTRIFEWPKSSAKKPRQRGFTEYASVGLFDLFCLHCHGITAEIVTLFIRQIQLVVLPDINDSTFIGSYVIWESISSKNSVDEMTVVHRKLLRKDRLMDKEMLIFPCHLRSTWHWVCIAVSLKDNWVSVFDSMGSTHIQLIEKIRTYMAAVTKFEQLQELPELRSIESKVPMQSNSIDCGPMMLNNILCLARREFKIERDTIEIAGDFTIADETRSEIIQQMFALQ